MSARRGRGLGPVDASPPPPVEQRCAALGDAIAVARRNLGGRDGGLLDEALAIDRRLQTIWSRHPRFVIVRHSASFMSKVVEGVAALQKIVADLKA